MINAYTKFGENQFVYTKVNLWKWKYWRIAGS